MTTSLAAPVAADPMLPELCRVAERWEETHDTFSMRLQPTDGSAPHSFAPGQFNMLYAFGVGEVAISMSGDPHRTDGYLHTIRAVGTVTNALRQLEAGATLGVRGPFGNSWPVDEAEGMDVVIVAGGVGLAPLRPLLYELAHQRQRFGRISLFYGARSPDDLLYQEQFYTWRDDHDIDVRVTVDRADRTWSGRIGVVPSLIALGGFKPQRTVAMICGPEVMARFSDIELRKRGVSPSRIYFSMERNMKCAVGICGRCQFGPNFICKDGPVFPYPRVRSLIECGEI